MKYDSATTQYAEEQEKRVSKLNNRIHHEDEISKDRNQFSRDYARIIYCSSFLRLQGKMQLLGIQHTEFFRNRLTHSFTVAQVAREIAANLGLREAIVVEAASLAHDLGNPPFGHYGEKILDVVAKDVGGFEGNAQTLRILSCLEKKHYEYGGLNLTLRTLLSVIKYFKKYEKGVNKKFIYDDDFEFISEQLEKHKLGREPNTIDMQIMDLSDRIAYAAHDLEDCLKLGYFTIDELLHEFKNHEQFKGAYEDLNKLVNESREFANKADRFGTSEEYSFLFRSRLTSLVVNTFVTDIYYSDSDESLSLKRYNLLCDGLKKLTFRAVTRKTAVQLYEKTGEKIINGLFKVFSDENYNKDLLLLPAEFRKYSDENQRIRNIIDYISGMMDSFATKEYEKYFGTGSLEKQYFEKS